MIVGPLYVLLLLCCGPALSEDVRVIPSLRYGTWEGWGTSLAWWAKQLGDRDDLADLLFTTKQVDYNNQTLPGLGLNIVRYNAGASSDKAYNGESMSTSPNIQSSRQIDAFWVDWGSRDPSSSSWNWSRDYNQQSMLLKAKQRGVDIFELFSNSPVWWMLYNNNPSGALTGVDNLQQWDFENHTVYMANIVKKFKDEHNLTFTSVDPFNEPSSPFWVSLGNQEGCHFKTSDMSTIIPSMRKQLDIRGLTNTIVSACDENRIDFATATWNLLKPEAKAAVGRVNVHGYSYLDGDRNALYKTVSGKKIWNSEFGDGDGTGIGMSLNINKDLVELHPTAWCYWQPFDIQGWGMINTDIQNKVLKEVADKYFVLAQYSRHIKPGMQIINAGFDGLSVAAHDAKNSLLVIVVVNDRDGSLDFNFNLSAFSHIDGNVVTWSTNSVDKYVEKSGPSIVNGQFSDVLPQRTVRTYEISGVQQ